MLGRTGPGAWSEALEDLVLAPAGVTSPQVVSGAWVGSTLFLPQVSFGCNARYWSPKNQDALVYHLYANSWRTDKASLARVRAAYLNQAFSTALLQLLLIYVLPAAALGYAVWVYVVPQAQAWVAAKGWSLGKLVQSKSRKQLR